MIPFSTFTKLLFALVMGAATNASANDGPEYSTRPSKPVSRSAAGPLVPTRLSSEKVCRADEDTLRIIRLTTFDRGVRVDYEFVVSGRATWTHMNRPLLKQFGIRAAGTFCLPKDTRAADETGDD